MDEVSREHGGEIENTYVVDRIVRHVGSGHRLKYVV